MIYLDNSATTRQHPKVTARMLEYIEENFGNPSSLHRAGLEAEKAIKEARRRIAQAMGNPAGTTVFNSGGTEGDNMAIFGAAKAMWRQGSKLITTTVEHPAVLECFGELEKEGYEVVRLEVDREGRPDMEEFESVLDDKTILVSMMHVNNEVGTVMPVNEVARAIKDSDSPALLHCDAVQSFGKMELPAHADIMAISGHKIGGPKGSGALWIREGLNLRPQLLGGGQEAGLRSGTENVPAIVGLGEAATIMSADRKETFQKVAELRKKLLEGLRSQIDDVMLNGPEEVGEAAGCASPYILNVSFLGTRGEVILHTLEQDDIYVSTGSACSSKKKGGSHVLEAMGLTEAESESAIRYSFSPDTTMEEIEKTVERTADAVSRFRKLGSFR